VGEATVGDMKGSKSLQDFSVKMVDGEGRFYRRYYDMRKMQIFVLGDRERES